MCKVLVDFINNYQKAVEDNKAQEEAEKKKKDKEEKEKAEKERQEKSKADRPASPGMISIHLLRLISQSIGKDLCQRSIFSSVVDGFLLTLDLPVVLLHRAAGSLS